MKLGRETPSVPFLFGRAVSRSYQGEIGGTYSRERHVWVVETPTGPSPIVEVRTDLLETSTKTAASQEVDDDDQGRPMLLELSTKTDVQQEVDDAQTVGDLLELETKTEVELEHDDQARSVV